MPRDVARCPTEQAAGGALILNADDWGRDSRTTQRTLECVRAGALSSVSAMVFMEDSERAARIARDLGLDVGLHLNLTTPLTARRCDERLLAAQQRLARHLRRSRFSQAVYHPALQSAFAHVVNSQLEEFTRLYGRAPGRIDGHHHMHLCLNVVLGALLPRDTIVRRHFSFQPGEKGIINRLYRALIDALLARRHQLTDFFFSLAPVQQLGRLDRIVSLAQWAVVEVEAHAVEPAEYAVLTADDFRTRIGAVRIDRPWTRLTARDRPPHAPRP